MEFSTLNNLKKKIKLKMRGYAVYQTKKFDVKLKESDIDKHISPTPSYNHFKNVLNNKQWNVLHQKKMDKIFQYLCLLVVRKIY